MPTCLRLADERVCSCKKAHDDVGYHVLNCSRNNKKNWPDYIYNGLATALAPSHSWVHRTRTVGPTFLWRSEMKRHHRQSGRRASITSRPSTLVQQHRDEDESSIQPGASQFVRTSLSCLLFEDKDGGPVTVVNMQRKFDKGSFSDVPSWRT